MFIARYDEATETVTFPYEIEEGERTSTTDLDPAGLGPDLDRHPRPRAVATRSRRAGQGARRDHLRRAHRIVARRPDPQRRHRHRRDRARGTWRRRRSMRGPSASSARSPRAWPSPSRTRPCSMRRVGCSPRPTSAPPSWPSSTASSRALPPSSTCSRCTSWSATSSRRSSTRRSSTSASTTSRRGSPTSRTPSSAGSATRTSPRRSPTRRSNSSPLAPPWSSRTSRPGSARGATRCRSSRASRPCRSSACR